MRTSASRPRKADASRLVTNACSGASGSPTGGGMCSISTSNSGSRLSPSGVAPSAGCVGARDAGPTGRVQRRQPQRVLGGLGGFVVEIRCDVEQQVVAGLDHLGDARVGPVGLVDDENHRKMRGQRLAQHEPRLRQRALGRVDQQQHPVHHGQPALHLTAEVGVAGGVDHVDDRDGPVRVMAVHGGVLGQDGDALFLLEVTAVHHAFLGVVTAVVQRPGLPQHRVDQGGLAVVDVGDDGDVTEWHVGDCGSVGASKANWRAAGRSAAWCAFRAARNGVSAPKPHTESPGAHTQRRGDLSLSRGLTGACRLLATPYQPLRRGAEPTNSPLVASSRLR